MQPGPFDLAHGRCLLQAKTQRPWAWSRNGLSNARTIQVTPRSHSVGLLATNTQSGWRRKASLSLCAETDRGRLQTLYDAGSTLFRQALNIEVFCTVISFYWLILFWMFLFFTGKKSNKKTHQYGSKYYRVGQFLTCWRSLICCNTKTNYKQRLTDKRKQTFKLFKARFRCEGEKEYSFFVLLIFFLA